MSATGSPGSAGHGRLHGKLIALPLRRPQLNLDIALPALASAASRIEAELGDLPVSESAEPWVLAGRTYIPEPDLPSDDLTPWLQRRLQIACAMARDLRSDAQRAGV